jgi:hypothetical protein
MRIKLYSHSNGEQLTSPEILRPLLKSLEAIDFQFRRRCADALRRLILGRLRELGWTDRIQLAAKSKISITAVNRGVGLCLQVGNMARFYADLLKLQTLFHGSKITSAIYILPSRTVAREIGQNIANADRMTKELGLYEMIITIPLVILELEGS